MNTYRFLAGRTNRKELIFWAIQSCTVFVLYFCFSAWLPGPRICGQPILPFPCQAGLSCQDELCSLLLTHPTPHSGNNPHLLATHPRLLYPPNLKNSPGFFRKLALTSELTDIENHHLRCWQHLLSVPYLWVLITHAPSLSAWVPLSSSAQPGYRFLEERAPSWGAFCQRGAHGERQRNMGLGIQAFWTDASMWKPTMSLTSPLLGQGPNI